MDSDQTDSETLAVSGQVAWSAQDFVDDEQRLDFSKPFLPEDLARTRELDFLTPDEQRILNQIRAHGYLHLFGLVEEHILPLAMDLGRNRGAGRADRKEGQAPSVVQEGRLVQHIRRLRRQFDEGFGTRCDCIGPPRVIARAVLAHQSLAVALLVLHVEWTTQRHWQECARDSEALDPRFASLMHHHWLEEMRHACMDTLTVASLATRLSPDERGQAVSDYLAIGAMLDAGLVQQTCFDLDAFQRASGRQLGRRETETFRAVQHQASRWTFLGSGMSNPSFLEAVDQLGPRLRSKVEAAAPGFS